ncbi:MAG TPA: UvrD-helicase domain-containing protein [Bdellovibrio sp.]|uniref:UvrD-helicase domain-containing protein n=1 Tax=Bdellovibrio sp. TaxID=28201 RepID=UPI002EF175F9
MSVDGDEIIFTPEQFKIIKLLESENVQASPGSGKTTTLVAKLGIISKKWTSQTKGVCVLSHTNVAKSEIQNRLKGVASNLSKYPHFVGTIQSFVDSYLASPMLYLKFGSKIKIVDDAQFTFHASKFTKMGSNLISYLSNKQDFKDLSSGEILGRLTFYYENELKVKLSSEVSPVKFKDPNGKSYKEAWKIKSLLASKGIINYEDAYALAQAFLAAYPYFKKIISNRFPLVLIDEVQDTDEDQINILSEIFLGNSVIQTFGDLNQSIFSDSSPNLHSEKFKPTIELNSTMRLSPSISSLVKSLSVIQQDIVGNKNRKDLKHCIIVFDDKSVSKVISKFGEIVLSHDLKGTFKAVGRVAKIKNKAGEYTLPHYFPSYKQEFKSTSIPTFSSFEGYCRFARHKLNITKNNYKELLNVLNYAIGTCLRLEEVVDEKERPISNDEIRKKLEQLNVENRRFLWSIVEAIRKADKISCTDISLLCSKLFPEQLPDGLKKKTALDFINAVDDGAKIDGAPEQNNNIFSIPDKIDIHVNTIHAVKGETHSATLLCDTFRYGSHVQPLIKYLLGNQIKSKSVGVREQHCLRLAYVALSRPKHLIGLAIPRELLSKQDEASLAVSWQIVDLTQ